MFFDLRTFCAEKKDGITTAPTVPSTTTTTTTTPTPTTPTPMDIESSKATTNKLANAPPTLAKTIKPEDDKEKDKNTTAVPTTPATSSGRTTRLLSAGKHAEEVMALLKASHPSLISDMESMAKELSSALQPEPEEILLSTVKNLLMECYQVLYQNHKITGIYFIATNEKVLIFLPICILYLICYSYR